LDQVVGSLRVGQPWVLCPSNYSLKFSACPFPFFVWGGGGEYDAFFSLVINCQLSEAPLIVSWLACRYAPHPPQPSNHVVTSPQELSSVLSLFLPAMTSSLPDHHDPVQQNTAFRFVYGVPLTPPRFTREPPMPPPTPLSPQGLFYML